MKKLIMLLTLTLIGCGEEPVDVDDTDVSKSNQCAKRIGTYKAVWTESSGDCGPMSDTIFISPLPFSSSADSDLSCSGTANFSQNNCEVTIDITCITLDDYKFITRGVANWSLDASQGYSTMKIIISDISLYGVYFCSSIYEVTYSRPAY